MNLKVATTDSNRTARLKCIYLVPAAFVLVVWHGLECAYAALRAGATEFLEVWNHQPGK